MLGSCRLQRRDAKEASLNRGDRALRDRGNSRKCLRAASREKTDRRPSEPQSRPLSLSLPHHACPEGLQYATGHLLES
jgi:hypothetical protein